MADILFINACARPNSRTLELAKHVLGKLEGDVEEVYLYGIELPPLDFAGMQVRGAADESGDFSDSAFDLAKQFASAKTVVIAAPYWDLMFPSVVKTYFESVTVSGLTFEYGDNGIPRGLCKAERLIYVTTSGGPIIYNFGYDYVSALAKMFYGINEVKCFSAQKLDIFGSDATAILEQAKSKIAL